ncbi:hypothetical protein RB2654_14380 [Rhodobacterales bacterium HTCC2654]|uniref:Uncharacterized protein n=1 Tax=Maritimibacter alkaliphilus HTCC2654 TaxID=314271 RepID=A3VGS5_9RHOB|nr:hypothetical protein RB2654_14380 [Rhodobacterales bacterium HTCC2654] [Maritimibacter alkaliphilus HTCC2654]
MSHVAHFPICDPASDSQHPRG